jgi:Spy/CpxP family protein refolding chaperone
MKVNHTKAITMAAIVALALSVGMAHAVLAQEGLGHGPGGPGFGKELNLTADQQAKMKQIREQNMASMKAIRDDQSLTPEQRQQKMQALHESMKTQMEAILTPEQQKKMAQMPEHQGRMGGPMLNGNPQRVAKELNLTADQQTKIKSIMQSSNQQMRTIEQNQSLSQQDKRAQINQLRDSTKTQISALLTPDQQQKFAQMHKGGPGGHGHRPGGPGGQQDNGAQQPPQGI